MVRRYDDRMITQDSPLPPHPDRTPLIDQVRQTVADGDSQRLKELMGPASQLAHHDVESALFGNFNDTQQHRDRSWFEANLASEHLDLLRNSMRNRPFSEAHADLPWLKPSPRSAADLLADALDRGEPEWAQWLFPLVEKEDYLAAIHASGVYPRAECTDLFFLRMIEKAPDFQVIDLFVDVFSKCVEHKRIDLAKSALALAEERVVPDILTERLTPILRKAWDEKDKEFVTWMIETLHVSPASTVYDLVSENEHAQADALAVYATGDTLEDTLGWAHEADAELDVEEDMPLSQAKHVAESRADQASNLKSATNSRARMRP